MQCPGTENCNLADFESEVRLIIEPKNSIEHSMIQVRHKIILQNLPRTRIENGARSSYCNPYLAPET